MAALAEALLGTPTLGLSSVTVRALFPTKHPHSELSSELLPTPNLPLHSPSLSPRLFAPAAPRYPDTRVKYSQNVWLAGAPGRVWTTPGGSGGSSGPSAPCCARPLHEAPQGLNWGTALLPASLPLLPDSITPQQILQIQVEGLIYKLPAEGGQRLHLQHLHLPGDLLCWEMLASPEGSSPPLLVED